MRFERRNLTWTLMPLFLAGEYNADTFVLFIRTTKSWKSVSFSGVICKTWEVEYQRLQICAVKGSSVVIPCSLYHPDNLTVKRVIWGHVTSHGSKGYFVSGSNFKKATKKFQYIGDKQHNCSLKIHQVESKDAGKYTVRLSEKNMKYIGSGIVRALKVVGKSFSYINNDLQPAKWDSLTVLCSSRFVRGTDKKNRRKWSNKGRRLCESDLHKRLWRRSPFICFHLV